MSAPADFATAAQALAAAVQAATVDPADGVRLLAELAGFTVSVPSSSAPIGVAIADMADACGDLFRRTAVIALALASADYQPSSYNDAANLRTMIAGLLDNEIQIAGDQGEDDSFAGLIQLRIAVVQDLTARGAALAPLTTVMSPVPLPADVLAQRLYRDPSRTLQLIQMANPIHPAFMPLSFMALAE